jgi:regulator of protease activity HflC (stomatin/prohibitin superfamily)
METGEKVGAAFVVFLLVFAAGAIICFMGFDIVQASHKGVMVRFGEIKGVMEPGIKWTGLFTSVEPYDLRIRKSTVKMEGAFCAPDKTGQCIYAQIDVNYKLKDNSVQSAYVHVGKDTEIVDKLNIVPIIVESFKRTTVQYEALDLLSHREEVAKATEDRIRERFPEEYFTIESVVVSNIDYSAQFNAAIDAAKTAVQLAQKAENDLERIKFEQQQEIEKYKADAEKLRLQKSEITEMLIQKQWIEKWDGKLPLYVISSQGTQDVLMNLPTIVNK